MATALTRSDEAEPGGRRSVRERVLAVLAVPGRLLGALLLPGRLLPRIIAQGRYGAALLTIVLCASLAALSVGRRIDLSREVPTVDGPPGQEVPLSEREISEKLEKQTAIEKVKLDLGASLGTLANAFLLAVGIFVLGWYVGGKPTFRRAGALAVHAMLPGALKSLIVAVVALRQPSILPEQVNGLFWPPAQAAFILWSIILVAIGLAPAAGISRARAAVATVVGTIVLAGIAIILSGGGNKPS